ncbi:MAG TPA: hypothetical protein VGC42_27855 [Kofleriaceae bacterium]
MRNNLGILGVVVGLVVAPAAARADDPVAGQYDIKFEPVSTNCQSPLQYPQHGQLKIDVKGNDVQVDIERTPLMVGKAAKTGKLSVKSARPGHTMIEGMDGVFSLAGRISAEGMVSLVMVGEYTHAGAPLCTQSWNLSGLRKSDAAPTAKPDAKPRR